MSDASDTAGSVASERGAPLGVRVLCTRSPKKEAGLEEKVPEGARGKSVGAVPGIMSCYAQRSAAGMAEPRSASGRITDTMPVPARAVPPAAPFLMRGRIQNEAG